MKQVQDLYSNTTLVKVKYLKKKNPYLNRLDSNTTLVKVKLKALCGVREKSEFKYNTC